MYTHRYIHFLVRVLFDLLFRKLFDWTFFVQVIIENQKEHNFRHLKCNLKDVKNSTTLDKKII